jgi:hypothetical protein
MRRATLLCLLAACVEAHLDQDTGGGLTKWFEPVDTVFIRFYTRFDAECDYVHHFVTLRANRSLRGGDKWSGFGGAGLRPEGNERFSTAIEPWGDWGRWTAPGRCPTRSRRRCGRPASGSTAAPAITSRCSCGGPGCCGAMSTC